MKTHDEMVADALESVRHLPVLEAVAILNRRQAEAEQVAADCAAEIAILKEQEQ